MFELHGERGMPSTRFKDLVDLVAIALGTSVAAEAQLMALRSVADRRGIALPARFRVPDRALWEPGYAAEAGRSLLPAALTLDTYLSSTRCSTEVPTASGTPSAGGGFRDVSDE